MADIKFPKKQEQRLIPKYLLDYATKLNENNPDPNITFGKEIVTIELGDEATSGTLTADQFNQMTTDPATTMFHRGTVYYSLAGIGVTNYRYAMTSSFDNAIVTYYILVNKTSGAWTYNVKTQNDPIIPMLYTTTTAPTATATPGEGTLTVSQINIPVGNTLKVGDYVVYKISSSDDAVALYIVTDITENTVTLNRQYSYAHDLVNITLTGTSGTLSAYELSLVQGIPEHIVFTIGSVKYWLSGIGSTYIGYACTAEYQGTQETISYRIAINKTTGAWDCSEMSLKPVTANTGQTSSATLTDLKIGNTVYEIPQGGSNAVETVYFRPNTSGTGYFNLTTETDLDNQETYYKLEYVDSQDGNYDLFDPVGGKPYSTWVTNLVDGNKYLCVIPTIGLYYMNFEYIDQYTINFTQTNTNDISRPLGDYKYLPPLATAEEWEFTVDDGQGGTTTVTKHILVLD